MGQARDFSTYVIADPCRDVKDATCVEVCPVDCIDTSPETDQYFIDPELCIACEQCVLVCPVEAIYLEHEVPEQWHDAIERNANFFRQLHATATAIPQEQVQGYLEAAKARAGELGVSVAIAIVDRSGSVVAEEGVGNPHQKVAAEALSKAYTSAVLERSTAQVSDALIAKAAARIDVASATREAGGIPFGRPYVIGAIGVAGGTPEQNHDCSRAALAAYSPSPP